MIDQGVDGICILANYSEQFLLVRRASATRCSTSACRTSPARVPVIVTCSHFSTQHRRGARARGGGGGRRARC